MGSEAGVIIIFLCLCGGIYTLFNHAEQEKIESNSYQEFSKSKPRVINPKKKNNKDKK